MMRRTGGTCALFLLVAGALLADLNSGLRAFDQKDYGFAISQFLPLAEKGNAQAQNALGFLYEHGLGILRNEEIAARWYRKSAEQGYGPSEYNFGLLFWKGRGVAQSDEQAIAWLRKASEHDIALAAFNLGTLYYKEGKGDAAEAMLWWKTAAERNVAAAAYNLAYLYAEGENVPHDYREAVKWYLVAAQQNYSLAQYALGVLYRNGNGVPADEAQARMWFERAAHSGATASGDGGERFVTVADDPGPAAPGPTHIVPDAGSSNYWPENTATGFFANAQGLVVTSFDAVRGCRNIVLQTAEGEQHASLAAQDAGQGLALLAAERGSGGATGLALSDDRKKDAKLVQVGFQLRGADATAQAVSGTWDAQNDTGSLQADRAPDPPLAGGPVLDASGRVIAFQTISGSRTHMVTASALARLLRNSNASAGGVAVIATDLLHVAEAAKKSLVLVECKPEIP